MSKIMTIHIDKTLEKIIFHQKSSTAASAMSGTADIVSSFSKTGWNGYILVGYIQGAHTNLSHLFIASYFEWFAFGILVPQLFRILLKFRVLPI